MKRYWITISVPADTDNEAEWRARRMAEMELGGKIVEVQPEPPQGSTIVGETHEDALPTEETS